MIKTLFFLAPKVWILPMKYESLFSAGPLCFPSTSSLLTCLGCSKVLVWQHPWILFLVESPLLGATQNNWTLNGLWSAGSKEGSARCENPRSLEHTHHLILHFQNCASLGMFVWSSYEYHSISLPRGYQRQSMEETKELSSDLVI